MLQSTQEVLNSLFTACGVVLQRLLSPLGIDGLPIPMMLQELCDNFTISLLLLQDLMLSMEVSCFLQK